jgi:hypothetical protein
LAETAYNDAMEAVRNAADAEAVATASAESA